MSEEPDLDTTNDAWQKEVESLSDLMAASWEAAIKKYDVDARQSRKEQGE